MGVTCESLAQESTPDGPIVNLTESYTLTQYTQVVGGTQGDRPRGSPSVAHRSPLGPDMGPECWPATLFRPLLGCSSVETICNPVDPVQSLLKKIN